MIISLSIEEFSSLEETQNRKESRIITSDIAKIVNEVYVGDEGYYRNYYLPSKINRESYVLQINGSGVFVNSHMQLTFSKINLKSVLRYEKYNLEPGYVYQFINNNKTIDIIKK
jgi:hypothetical protein